MLARRRFMGGGESCPYQRIEYLEVSKEEGKAFIDTEFVPEGIDIDIHCKFKLNSFVSERYYAWYSTYDGPQYNCYLINEQNGKLGVCHGTSGNAVTTYIPLSKDGMYEISAFGKTRILIANDQEKIMTPYIDKDSPLSLILFRSDRSEGIVEMRLYSFRLDKEGMTKFDLIPVRVGNEGFMYDRVSGRLLGNSGSGRFVLGPDLA